jgi:microcystin-dependent protein
MAINPSRKGAETTGGLNAESHALLDHTGVPGLGGLPTGTVLDFAGSEAPDGWLECNGSSYSIGAQTRLFAVIGYAWGGSGASFNVPDLRRRTTVGRGGVGTAVLGSTVGQVGGAEAHALTVGELASHGHSDPGHAHNLQQASPTHGTYGDDVPATGSAYFVLTGSNAGNLQPIGGVATIANAKLGSTGSNTAHNNVQPSAVMMKIIKA